MRDLRSLMPALQNKKYFNYGGQGPLPLPSLEAITTSWNKVQHLGPFTNDIWPYVTSEIKTTKQLLANICDVPVSRIALTENVTSGCVLPMLGIPFIPGDRILISDCEHPGIMYACTELAHRQQLTVDILPVKHLRYGVDNLVGTEEALIDSLDSKLRPNTRLVILSHLLWNTGQIMPISAVAEKLSAHPNTPYLLVDAAQSFGQIPIKDAAAKADIYAFTGHKWACGPEGLGAVVTSERVLEESNPTLIGWRSLKNEGHIQDETTVPFHKDGRRFEVATSCLPLLAGLRSSLHLLANEGTEIERLKKIQAWSSQFWNGLQSLKGVSSILEAPPPAGLVSFTLNQITSPQEVVKILGNQGLWIRDLEDPACLRACFHITSVSEEIKMLNQAIKKLTTTQ